MLTLDKLKIGQSAIVQSFKDQNLSLKFVEMGCLPGERLTLTHIAPLGDPIAIEISGYQLSMRKNEASTIEVIIENEN